MKVTLGKKSISIAELSSACGGLTVPTNGGDFK